MFHDARLFEPAARLDADICIVGAGAAGITLAREFLGAGRRVYVLESGDFGNSAQALAHGESVGQPYPDLALTRQRRFGGTTGWWTGECRPLDAQEDMAPRAWLDHPGWPVSAAELAGLEDRARAVCRLPGPPFEPAGAWLRAAGAAPLALDPQRFVTRIFQYAAATDFAAIYRRELGAATDVQILLHATAVAVATDPARRTATGVRVLTAPGRELVIAAGTVILAAGGIENARLLLASPGMGSASLGNEHDQVGRCFMEHLFFDDVASYQPVAGVPAAKFYGRRGRIDGAAFKAAIAPTASLLAESGILNCCFKLASPVKRHPALLAALALRDALATGRRRTGLGPLIADLVALAPSLALELVRIVRDGEYGRPARPRALPVSVVAEQAPNEASRVTLSARHDALGQPLARLDWRLTAADRSGWRRGLETLAQEVEARGLGRLDLPDPDGFAAAFQRLRGGCHHMGTTRMAERPAQGVVDRDCRLFDVAGLYVAGSSVFPTSGHANPTLTIVTLALRLAGHLKRGF